MMKKFLLLLLVYLSFSFGNDFCVFDAKGSCVSNLQDMREAQNVFQEKSFKKHYIASKAKPVAGLRSYKSVKPTKSSGHKRWYEVDWNQGVIFCPEKEFNTGDGIWIVNGSARMDSKNCLYVDGSPYTRSILVLYARNLNDLTDADSSWILVNQAIVNLKGKDFIVYGGVGRFVYGNAKDTSYAVQMKYDLIVDKTELRVRDALWLREGEKINEKESVLCFNEDYYPSSDSLEVLDYPSIYYHYYLSFRSKKDGLESVENCTKPTECTYNESANGYRLPYYDEWYILQNAGQSKVFSWGDDFIEDSLKRYADIHCFEKKSGLYPVKQYAPNQYGLYDIYGNAEEKYYKKFGNEYIALTPCSVLNFHNPGKACRELLKYKCLPRDEIITNATFKKPAFQGMRMVRVLD